VALTGDSPTSERTPAPKTPGGPPPRRRSVTALVALIIGGISLLAMGAVVLLTFSPAVKRADRAINEMLAPAPPRSAGATELVFGMASPFTGANRELGRAMRAGVEAAFGEVNAAGGIHGRRLRLVAVDDGYEPSRTGPAMKQLVEKEQVFAVVGTVGTPTAAVSIPYCMEHKVIFLGALSGGDQLRRRPPDRYVFNFRPSYSEETAAAVRYLVRTRRIPAARVAVFAQEDAFGESGFRGASEELSARGVDPARILRVGYRRNTADVADAVATLKARARELDAVVMVATYKAAAAFVRALREDGLRFLVTNVSAVDTNALAEELVTSGRPYAEGVMVTQIVPLPTSRAPGVVRFQDAMALHAKGERPGFLALEGFVVAQVLAEGLRRAGRELDTEKLVAALESIKALDLGLGTTISFAADDHQGSRKVWGTLLQADGTWKSIDLE
jgi:branched-chain amino acid transport system substrate-binding protein